MNKTILERAMKENYVTGYPTATSGYLLTDGSYLHLINKKDEDRGGNYREDHRTIRNFFNKRKNDNWSGMVNFVKMGHIRFSPECHGFDFIKKPTKWQAAQILRQCSRLLPDEYWIERLDKDFRVVETFTKNEFRAYCRDKGII